MKLVCQIMILWNVNSTKNITTIVYLFPGNRDDDEDADFTAKTIISIAYNTIFDELLDFIETISDDIVFPYPYVLKSIVLYRSNYLGSDHNNVSGDVSDCESLNEYTKQFLGKGGTYDITKQHLKTINKNSALESFNELKAMNGRWKNYTMISFTHLKIDNELIYILVYMN